MRTVMTNKTVRFTALAAATLLFSCVEHRPVRNGLRDESIYLDKAALTNVNPKAPDSKDDGWLMKVTVVKTSSPNPAGDYAFPGMESDTKYVKLRFNEEALQVIDGRTFMIDRPTDPNDDLATTTGRVMMEFAGSHVDVKLRESLDGERTNYLEENTEEPWAKRQKFKVDFEKTSLDPFTTVAWYYGEFLHDCVRPVSAHAVPGSYEWDEKDQSLQFVIESNYIFTVEGGCYDMMSFVSGSGTGTIQYRVSFYRPGQSAYQREEIAEKDPVNKKYGSIQVMNPFHDEKSGLLSAKTYIQRWDPNRTEPVVYYFAEGFPENFKKMFTDEIKAQTNKIMEDAGAKLRFDFKEWNDGGIERHQGDLRYSFVAWHQDIDGTRGLLGYGPSSSDPRTGEVLSANVNLYNIGQDYYRFMIQDYLERVGAQKKPDPAKKWEEIACTQGQTVAPTDQKQRFTTGLFQEMARVMELSDTQLADGVTLDDFLPEPKQDKAAFLNNYNKLLNELRFFDPLYNAYVYRTTEAPVAEYKQKKAVDAEFTKAMDKILHNEDPFGGVSLYSRDGIEKQNQMLQKFRTWKKNRKQLEQLENAMFSHKCVYTFDAGDAISAIGASARQCVQDASGGGWHWESDDVYRERIIEAVTFHVGIHEFGHTLSLRHNFYGSVDAKHMDAGEVTASVMDYVRSQEEIGAPRIWHQYDVAALSWIFGTAPVRTEQMKKDLLYCTDEHSGNSPLCRTFDLGTTPSQIVLNAIERYDLVYEIRNRRAYRTFWDTSGYDYAIYDAVFPLQRMWYLALFDWGGGGVQDTLKRLDQITGTVKSDPEYNEIAADYTNDVSAAIGLTMAFYDAIINQPASSRNYMTEYDPYYGDVLRLGIITDKLYATFAFMDLQEVWDYDPNYYTYVAMYDAPFSNKNQALSQRVLDNMLGANYDTFPWFQYYALNIYASVTNTNLVDSAQLKERIAIRRYNNKADFVAEFGAEAYDAANASDNTAGVFTVSGALCDGPNKMPCGEYAYTYLQDRGWHLVAGKSRSPVSYQYIRDYNEQLRGGASDSLDNYGLKVLLAYHEYYNNFSGY
ncbi:MAG: zinc-dependent metalloprotease [Myxococcales bacterium]